MAADARPATGGFLAGTPVWTERGPQAIEQLKAGDRVLSRSERMDQPVTSPVTRTLAGTDQAVMSLRCCLPPPDDETIHQLYVTDEHSLWIKGAGWTSAHLLEGGEELELPDGRTAYVLEVVLVFRTDRPGVAWMPEYSHSVDGFEIDFSDGRQYWLDDRDQRNFGASKGRFVATVYDLEVDGAESFYIGELGVRVRGAMAEDSA